MPAPPLGHDDKASVHLDVAILEILDIDVVSSILGMKYALRMQWRDSRVTFRNLKGETFMNAVNEDDADKIWIPEVVYTNTKDMDGSMVRKRLHFRI